MAFNNDSSQSEHPRSLIKVFAVSMKKLCIWIPAGSSKDIIQAQKKFKNAISVSILFDALDNFSKRETGAIFLNFPEK